jgi:hypothetical protein
MLGAKRGLTERVKLLWRNPLAFMKAWRLVLLRILQASSKSSRVLANVRIRHLMGW